MSTINIISKAIKFTYGNFITNLPYYHIDRSRDPPIHNWHDIVLFGMQTLGPMDSSLTHTLKVFLSPHGQQRERVKLDLSCMWSLGPMGSSLTHTQSRNLFPPWTAGKNASSKVKGHWPGFDFIVTKTTKTKSGDHQEITHGMVLKSHKLIGYITLKHIVSIEVVSEKF